MAHKLCYVKSLKGVKIVHLNIRSLLCHVDELKYEFLDGSFDIVILSETWLHGLVADSLICCDDYNLLRLDRQAINPKGGHKTGGGLSIYVKDCYETTGVTDHYLSNSNVEFMHVIIKGTKQKIIDLFTIYRPP